MELIIPLDPQGKKPLYEQIYRHIKTEIRNGNLKPQMRLPSTSKTRWKKELLFSLEPVRK